MINYKYNTIVTLGPPGTDAENVAKKISKEIILKDSFEEAAECAFQNDYIALICCGYVKKDDSKIIDCWVDLNFRYTGKLKIIDCFYDYTKPMAIAKHKNVDNPKSIIIHPATEAFVKKFDIKAENVLYSNSKPMAVQQVVDGNVDMCIGSVDVIDRFDEMENLHTFNPQMVWALYKRDV